MHSSPMPLTPAGAPTNGFSALIAVGTRQRETHQEHISWKRKLILKWNENHVSFWPFLPPKIFNKWSHPSVVWSKEPAASFDILRQSIYKLFSYIRDWLNSCNRWLLYIGRCVVRTHIKRRVGYVCWPTAVRHWKRCKSMCPLTSDRPKRCIIGRDPWEVNRRTIQFSVACHWRDGRDL